MRHTFNIASFSVALAAWAGFLTASDSIDGKVVRIVDGDTIDVLTADATKVRIRLHGIDCPEKGQPYGSNAKKYTSLAVGGKHVRVVVHGKDRYGRTIGEVFHNGTSVNVALVNAGLGWHYVKYAPRRADLSRAQSTAKRLRKGLWGGSQEIVPPWEWRTLRKTQRDKLR